MSKISYSPSDDQVESAVNRSKTRAEAYLQDPQRSKQLLEQATNKVNRNKDKIFVVPEFWTDLKTFFRLLSAFTHRQYRKIPWGSIAMVTGAIIYFLSPLDLMLDWIPFAGFIDDAAILLFVSKQIHADLERFKTWEYERSIPPPLLLIAQEAGGSTFTE